MAPGDNLEISRGKSYEARVKPVPGLDAFVEAGVRNRPDAGEPICKGVRLLDITFGTASYAVLVVRLGQRVGFLSVFERPQEDALLDRAMEQLRKSRGA